MNKKVLMMTVLLAVTLMSVTAPGLYAAKELTPMMTSPLFKPPAREVYTIYAGRAMDYAKTKGFKFSMRQHDIFSNCGLATYEGGLFISMSAYSPAWKPGAKCDFTLFSGRQIAEGWKFVSYDSNANCPGTGKDYTVTERPTAGSRTIRFKVHSWVESGKGICTLYLNQLKLEGPANARWQDAFL